MDADGELRRTAALDQLDQGVQIVGGVAREADRKRARKAGVDELATSPREHVGGRPLVTLLYPHASLVPVGGRFLPRKDQTRLDTNVSAHTKERVE